MKKKCPKCSSEEVKVVKIHNSKFLLCDSCGYDESEELLDTYPSGRSRQVGKTKHSPYKKGGPQRTRK